MVLAMLAKKGMWQRVWHAVGGAPDVDDDELMDDGGGSGGDDDDKGGEDDAAAAEDKPAAMISVGSVTAR